MSVYTVQPDELIAYSKNKKSWRKSIVIYARTRIGINPSKQQIELFEAILQPHAMVSVRAGHNTGKSTAAAIVLLWALECIEFSRVACTAPTGHQLQDVLWAEVAKMIRLSDEHSRKYGLSRAFWLSELVLMTQRRVAVVGYEESWFAMAQTARKETGEGLQGIHASEIKLNREGSAVETEGENSQMIFIVDEASGVADNIFEVAEGALASPNSRLLMLGNPTRAEGYFYNSHHKVRAHYIPLHFPTLDSPLAPPGYADRIARMWGKDSNMYRVRVLGDFPITSDNVLISLSWIEAAIMRPAPAPNPAPIYLGVDVARFGDDRTVLCRRQGKHVQDIRVYGHLDTMQVAGVVMDYCYRNQIDTIFVDAVGLGAGVADRLRELNMPAVDVQSAESAPERRKDDPDSTEMYAYKIRDYLYLEMMKWFRDFSPSLEGCDELQVEMLAGEASSLQYEFNSAGFVKLESKADFKKRLGGEEGRSPDIADALALTFAPDTGSIWERL